MQKSNKFKASLSSFEESIKEFELLRGKNVFIKVIEALRQNIRPLRQNIIRGPLR